MVRKSIVRVLVHSTYHHEPCHMKNIIFIEYLGSTKKDCYYILLCDVIKQVVLHPNCRHELTTYYLEQEKNINIMLETGSIAPINIQILAERKNSWINAKEKMYNLYNDVTTEWLVSTSPNSHEILDAEYFIFKEKKYKVDGKNVVIEYSKKEKEVAKWLESTFGGELYMLPRINQPEGIKTADYLFRGEYWDLKEINGNGKNVFFHAVEKHEKQSHNFIFDVSNSILTDSEIDDRINSLYKLPKLKWLDKIIIKRGKNLIRITKKK